MAALDSARIHGDPKRFSVFFFLFQYSAGAEKKKMRRNRWLHLHINTRLQAEQKRLARFLIGSRRWVGGGGRRAPEGLLHLHLWSQLYSRYR